MTKGILANFEKSQKQKTMEHALMASQILFNLLGGLGLFFTGIGVLWLVAVYKTKKE